MTGHTHYSSDGTRNVQIGVPITGLTYQPPDDSVPASEEALKGLWERLVGIRWDNMSQAEMARRLEQLPSGVNKMENRPKRPFLHTMNRYAGILGYELRITLRRKDDDG